MIGLLGAVVRFGARTVLDGLSFTVPVGRSLAILGPNGRGKTTALRSMLGFQQLESGQRIAPPIVGYVPQTGSTNQRLKAVDIAVMGCAARLGLFGQPGPTELVAARAALQRAGAAPFEHSFFDRLSGGERQLVLLARALATGSPALVLDEPGAALDLANQQRLLLLLEDFRRARDKAIVFTTHDPNHALAAADDALLLMPTGPAVFGPVDEVVVPEQLEQLYGVPMCVVEVRAPDGLMHRAVLPAFAGARAA